MVLQFYRLCAIVQIFPIIIGKDVWFPQKGGVLQEFYKTAFISLTCATPNFVKAKKVPCACWTCGDKCFHFFCRAWVHWMLWQDLPCASVQEKFWLQLQKCSYHRISSRIAVLHFRLSVVVPVAQPNCTLCLSLLLICRFYGWLLAEIVVCRT